MMKVLKRLTWIGSLACLLTFTTILQAQPTLNTQLQKTDIVIGDPVSLIIQLDDSDNSIHTIQWPATDTSYGAVEILQQSTDTIEDGKGFKHIISLTAFDSGRVTIPALPVIVKYNNGQTQTFLSDSSWLNVQLVAVDTTKDFRDIKAIKEVELSWLDYWPLTAGILGLLLMAALVYVWWKKRRKKTSPAVHTIQETYWERAVRLTHELQEKALWNEGKDKEHYTALSAILKQYIAERFDIVTADKTTTDIIKAVKRIKDLNPYRKTIREMLDLADLAKFAKARPTPQEHLDRLNDMQVLLQATKPNLSSESNSKNDLNHSKTVAS